MSCSVISSINRRPLTSIRPELLLSIVVQIAQNVYPTFFDIYSICLFGYPECLLRLLYRHFSDALIETLIAVSCALIRKCLKLFNAVQIHATYPYKAYPYNLLLSDVAPGRKFCQGGLRFRRRRSKRRIIRHGYLTNVLHMEYYYSIIYAYAIVISYLYDITRDPTVLTLQDIGACSVEGKPFSGRQRPNFLTELTF